MFSVYNNKTLNWTKKLKKKKGFSAIAQIFHSLLTDRSEFESRYSILMLMYMKKKIHFWIEIIEWIWYW